MNRYFIEIEASKGMSSHGDVAIDDVSWSPECFGIGLQKISNEIAKSKLISSNGISFAGVPPEVVKDFDYYKPIIESEIKPEKHADFINKTGNVARDR